MSVPEDFPPNPEADRLAWVCAQMSAAALGHLKPGDAYAGRPLAPIEEILRLRLAAETLAVNVARYIYGRTFTPADQLSILNAAVEEADEKTQVRYAVQKEGV
jgi:hypothetical protein